MNALVVIAALAALTGGDSSRVSVADLPLTVVPAATATKAIALFMTGDGGWAKIDRTVSANLAAHGVEVIGLDSRAYLAKKRDPAGTARDVERALRHFLVGHDSTPIALIGYSRGAEIVPFVANRLEPDLRARLALVAMLAPTERASFEFHWSDLVSTTHRPTDLLVEPEVARLRDVRMLCVYGRGEEESLCRDGDAAVIHPVVREGGHHFDGDYAAVAAEILRALFPAAE